MDRRAEVDTTTRVAAAGGNNKYPHGRSRPRGRHDHHRDLSNNPDDPVDPLVAEELAAAEPAGPAEKVVYRGGWRMPLRSTVTKRSVALLVGKAGPGTGGGGWSRVAGSATQVQREVFVKASVFEQDVPYALRMHVHQPDMNISLSKVVRSRELATILLPLFRNSVSKPVARAIEDSAHLPEDDDDDDGDGGSLGIVERSLRRFIKTGWAPRRVHLVKWLLERLRILEDVRGALTLKIEPTPAEAAAWVESETRRRFKMLTGGRSALALQTAMANRIQNVWRGVLAKKRFAGIREEYDEKIANAKADAIQNAWKNHLGRRKLHRLGQAFRRKMQHEAAELIQQQVRGALARLHFRHTKDEAQRAVDAAIMIQSAWRARQSRARYAVIRAEYEQECLLKQSAIIIQSWFRRRRAELRVGRLRRERDAKLREQAAVMLQCAWRSRRAYLRYRDLLARRDRRKHKAATRVQRHVRGSLARAALRRWQEQAFEDHRAQQAASKLAAVWRGHVQRRVHGEKLAVAREVRRVKRRRGSATAIQKEIRAALARSAFKFSRSEINRQNSAAIIIQSRHRGFRSRRASAMRIKRARIADRLAQQMAAAARRRKALEDEAARVLARERARLADQLLEIERNTASLMVQSAWRGRMARRRFHDIRVEYDAKIQEARATQIQFAWRNRVGRKKLRKLEAWYAGKLQDQASRVIQQHTRGTLARMRFKAAKTEKERERQAAIMLESAWRMHAERRKYRAILAEKQREKERLAALCVQCAWRARRSRDRVNALRAERDDKLREQAAIILQCAWRQRLARKEFQKRRRRRLHKEEVDRQKREKAEREAQARAEREADAAKRAAAAKEARRKEVQRTLEARAEADRIAAIKKASEERDERAKEKARRREEAERDRKGREDRQRRREEAAARKKRARERERQRAIAEATGLGGGEEDGAGSEGSGSAGMGSTGGSRGSGAGAADDGDAGALAEQTKEETTTVYKGMWEMPCDLKREPWCECRVKVMERRNPYRLRFEARVKLMWTTELADEETGEALDLTRRAKYTVTHAQLQQVLLPAFDTEAMSPVVARRQTTASGTSTYGGRRSAESALFRWAQTGFSPLRDRVIQWILQRMRVGVGSKSLVLKLSEEMTEAYELEPGKRKKKRRRASAVARKRG